MLIGIDDTDSKHGMCTTYLGTILKKALEKEFHESIELRLIRLNPTIRFKTRGNASICLALKHSFDLQDIVREYIERMAHLDDDNTNPGAVFFKGDKIPQEIQSFANEAMYTELLVSDALDLIEEFGLGYLAFKNGRGLIGALAAIGARLDKKYTYELVAYRFEDNFTKKRYINARSVFFADVWTYPYTWDTVDRTNETVIFAPRSYDPILYGIRGDDPHHMLTAHSKIIAEPYEYLALYKTNQGTDAHIQRALIQDLEEGCSYIMTATVIKRPFTIPGGHTFFTVDYGCGTLLCAAFEPTKQFRAIVRELSVGDVVTVQGSYLENSLHLEKLQLIELSDLHVNANPICCEKSMKSLGRGKGFKCAKCKTEKRTLERTSITEKRGIKLGAYEVAASARRHLAEPLIKQRDRGSAIFPSR